MADFDIKYLFAIFRRWLPFIFVLWALVTGIALAIAMLLPPVYRATASILVESQQISEDLARSTVEISSLEQIQVLQQQLMTRANLLELADQFQVFGTNSELSPTEVVDRMTAATEFDQAQYGNSRNNPGAIVFDVSFRASSANLAASVTNQMATLILEQNVRIRTGRASETMQFFENTVNDLGAELTALEAEILAFKNANDDALPDSLEFRRDQITILQERMLQLERDDVALQESKAALELAMETNDGETTLAGQATPNQLALAELKNQLAVQGAIYSQTNPIIIQLKSRIAAMENLVREEAETAVAPGGGAVPSTLSGQLAQVNSRLATIQGQRDDVNAQILKLQESISRTPANEVKLNSLERNYENIRIQYVEAQKKLAEAATGEQLELRQKGERFELIEEPSVPDRPISPNRKLIAAGGSFVGLLLALGIMMLFEMLNRSVRRPNDLIRKLDITPFSTVPYVRTGGEMMKARAVTGSWILALAGGIPAALYLIHYNYLPLDLLLQNVMDRTGLAGLLENLNG
jgi:polysaccharide chain length determinant protein (PEP-CTERM system associated)